MSNDEYLNDAQDNMENGRQYTVPRDGGRLNFVSSYGNGFYKYTSTSMNQRTIFTHMTEGDEIDGAYLANQGITLPNGF